MIYLLIIGYLICAVLAYGRIWSLEFYRGDRWRGAPLVGAILAPAGIIVGMLLFSTSDQRFLLYRNPDKVKAKRLRGSNPYIRLEQRLERQRKRAEMEGASCGMVSVSEFDFDVREAPEVHGWR